MEQTGILDQGGLNQGVVCKCTRVPTFRFQLMGTITLKILDVKCGMEAPSTFCCICESIKPPLEAVGLVVLVVRECQLLNFKIYKLLRPLASVGLEVDKLFIGDHPELVVSFNCRSVRPPARRRRSRDRCHRRRGFHG